MDEVSANDQIVYKDRKQGGFSEFTSLHSVPACRPGHTSHGRKYA